MTHPLSKLYREPEREEAIKSKLFQNLLDGRVPAAEAGQTQIEQLVSHRRRRIPESLHAPHEAPRLELRRLPQFLLDQISDQDYEFDILLESDDVLGRRGEEREPRRLDTHHVQDRQRRHLQMRKPSRRRKPQVRHRRPKAVEGRRLAQQAEEPPVQQKAERPFPPPPAPAASSPSDQLGQVRAAGAGIHR